MADKQRLYDSHQTNAVVACPACGQKYMLSGLMIQRQEEIACSTCNALFRLKIEGSRIEPYEVSPATGGTIGPAEGPVRS